MTRKKLLEKEYHLPIARILYYFYWTKGKSWKEIASILDVPQRTVERWAEKSGIKFRSYVHQMMFPLKTEAEIEEKYGKSFNKVVFYSMLKGAVISKVISNRPTIRKGVTHWPPERLERLKQMWLGKFVKKEIAKILGCNTWTIYRKGEELGLPVRELQTSLAKEKIPPTRGVRKCHNCLEEIRLSKDGLDKDYRGAVMVSRWILWHLPGQCPIDSSTHARLLAVKERLI